jgi:hypothetical protein
MTAALALNVEDKPQRVIKDCGRLGKRSAYRVQITKPRPILET